MSLSSIFLLNRYQELAGRTDRDAPLPSVEDFNRLYLAAAAASEAGEIFDYLKKVIVHGHRPSFQEVRLKVREEIGDTLWYLARLAARFDIDLAEVAQANIEKLQTRYPDGFSVEDSIQRVDTIKNK